MATNAPTLKIGLAPANLQAFQAQFGDYLRDQNVNKTQKKHPNLIAHIPERVGRVYRELVFNNLKGFLRQCFPVCKTLISDEKWEALNLDFFQHGDLHSPYFTEINQHFVDYLSELSGEDRTRLSLPDYFAELAHYEWVELLLDVHPDEENSEIYLGARLNPTIHNLHYEWAVSSISANYRPDAPKETFILVYRNLDDNVEFTEINAMTHALGIFIQQKTEEKQTYENKTTLIKAFFHAVNIDTSPQIVTFGEQVINQFIEQQVILQS